MELDKKTVTVAGAVAAVAAGAIGAAVAYTTLGREQGEGKKPSKDKARLAKQGRAEPKAAPTGTININQAQRDDLLSLKHIGRARVKRILAGRPFRSVDDLVTKGLLPAEVLAEHRDRLTV